MPEYRVPGVYVEEVARGPRPIEGVGTSTAAFLGETERGRVSPQLVTSYGDYVRWFGKPFDGDKFLPDAVRGFFENGGKRAYIARVAGRTATTAGAAFGAGFVISAAGPGSWGRRLWVVVSESSSRALDADGNSVPIGFRVRVGYWPAGQEPFDFVAEPERLPRPVTEDFDDCGASPVAPGFQPARLPAGATDGGDADPGLDSAFIVLVRTGADPDAQPASGSARLATDGADAAAPLGPDDYVGLPGASLHQVQGLTALEQDQYDDVALVYAPAVGAEIARVVLAHCERLRFRFAVIDGPAGLGDPSSLDPRATVADTSFGAFYFPWIVVVDPESGARRRMPPGGHVLGTYARTDEQRGVSKAPANESLREVDGLEHEIGDALQQVLNPRGVNLIRRFQGRGFRVWGARTLSADPLWRYVNVRRLFIFLERSIHEGTKWVVFEANGKVLWARLADSIRSFLTTQWKEGALLGNKPEEAFFVRCDETTMSRHDIEIGRLICEIGIAPVRPSEFVLFRICHAGIH